MNKLKIRDQKLNRIMTLVDLVVGLPFRVSAIFRKKSVVDLTKESMSKILLLSTNNIGDTLLLTPAIRAIRVAYPTARIDVFVRPFVKGVLANNPDVSNIITNNVPWFENKLRLRDVVSLMGDIIKIRRESYSLIIDFRGDFRNIFCYLYLGHGKYRLSSNRSGGTYFLTHVTNYEEDIHAIDKSFSLLTPLGLNPKDRNMKMHVTEADRSALKVKVRDLDFKGYLIGIHPGAVSKTRRWPLERFAELVNSLSDRFPCTFYISGDNSEKELGARLSGLTLNKAIDLTGILSIPEISSLLEMTDLFICNETGIMHLSVALKTKTVAIYGPQLPMKFGHINEHSQIVWKKYDCCPCLHQFGCSKTGTTRALCIDAVKVDDVVECATRLIRAGNPIAEVGT